MANTELIHQKLPQNLREIALKYTISDNFLEKKSELIALILDSKSMDTEQEKQSWFNLLPMMTEEQIIKLEDILQREQQKLSEIEKKYEQKKDDVIQKYVQKFDEWAYQNKIIKLQQNEAIHEKKDDEEADQLLNNL